MTALLHVDNISKRFGGFIALDGIDLDGTAAANGSG